MKKFHRTGKLPSCDSLNNLIGFKDNDNTEVKIQDKLLVNKFIVVLFMYTNYVLHMVFINSLYKSTFCIK